MYNIKFFSLEILLFFFYKVLFLLFTLWFNVILFTNQFIFEKVIISLCLILCILLAVAFFTLVERKVMGFMQRRRGPNVVGFYGLLQPLADGVKLILKETILPYKANDNLFYFSPIFTFFLSLLS